MAVKIYRYIHGAIAPNVVRCGNISKKTSSVLATHNPHLSYSVNEKMIFFFRIPKHKRQYLPDGNQDKKYARQRMMSQCLS